MTVIFYSKTKYTINIYFLYQLPLVTSFNSSSTALLFLVSLAFISNTSYPNSFATIVAAVVLPIPGGPDNNIPLFKSDFFFAKY